MTSTPTRRFFHSFPRPKSGEDEDATIERGLAILGAMKKIGLVLAPEIVEWDLGQITGGREELKLLQRRASFTELSDAELPPHTEVFGPISLSFDIGALREAGATPVMYIPQGLASSALSQIGTFCVRGAYHTRAVLRQLQDLQRTSNPKAAAATFGRPMHPDCNIALTNTDAAGKVVATYDVPAAHVQQVLNHVGYNNIPFDHSTGILSVFINMFYPADNMHTGDELGYYRQREWRLIAGDVNFNSQPMGRPLSSAEISELETIDPGFWTRQITYDGKGCTRSELALVYDPVPNWNFLDLVEAVVVPARAAERVKSIVGDKPVQVLGAE
jgi:hypothetical protein